MTDSLIVKSQIKALAADMSVGADVADALDKKAKQLLLNAVERAKANGRRTVMGKDL